MEARKKMPGGALQRADRAGMDVQATAAIHLHTYAHHRELQVARLSVRHGLSHRRAVLLADFVFGGGRF